MVDFQPPPTMLLEALKRFKERDLRWLWHYLPTRGVPLPLEQSVMRSERPSVLTAAINKAENRQQMISCIKAAHKNFLVDESRLKWLDKNDDRLLIWMLARARGLPLGERGYPPFQTPEAIPGARRDEIILLLDLWSIPVDQKISALAKAKQDWAKEKTSDADTRWINPKDRVQLRWAWSYLNKKHNFFLPAPINDQEYYIYTLASLDSLSRSHPADKKLLLEKMKKTWAQKKYRDSGKAKKLLYMPLTKKTRVKLEELAAHNETKPHDLIEALIQKEHEQTFPAESEG